MPCVCLEITGEGSNPALLARTEGEKKGGELITMHSECHGGFRPERVGVWTGGG